MAAVQKVVQVVWAATSTWLKMIDGQFTARVDFRDAAVFTGRDRAVAHLLPEAS
jgi:hypothetical protein